MKKIIFTFCLISVSSVNAEYKMLLNNSQKIDIPEKKEIIEETNGPEFWTAINVDFNNLYPTYSDASSSGVGKGNFNFGQDGFLGDPKGFAPYDVNYDSSLWVNGSLDSQNFITPPNISSARYIKSYSSGQYYFEVTIGGTAHADIVGLGLDSNAQINNQSNAIGISSIGTFRNSKNKIYKNVSETWSTSLSIQSGDTIQVYLDYDNNRFLTKKLGTDVSSYSSPILVE